ncbi:MAG: hypothetical protein RBS57_04995, partial [Desulforhabdus sp.]|nr:hypothetical protein [Desulforhabdus sp.]
MRRFPSTTLHGAMPIVPLQLLLIGIFLLSSQLSGCSFQARPFIKTQESTQSTDSTFNRTEASRTASKIEAVCIYTIADGQSFQRVLSEQDIRKDHRLNVAGYVSGVVVLGSPGLTISIDGNEANRASRDADGSFDIKNFGKLHPDEMIPSGRTYYGLDRFQRKIGSREEPTFHAYSFFPTILAVSVSERNDFSITIASKDQALNLFIRQCGHKSICTLGGDRE